MASAIQLYNILGPNTKCLLNAALLPSIKQTPSWSKKWLARFLDDLLPFLRKVIFVNETRMKCFYSLFYLIFLLKNSMFIVTFTQLSV